MDGLEARAHLRRADILAALPDAALAKLAGEVSWREVDAGESVLAHLDRDRSVYFLIDGVCNARMTGPTGRAFPIRRLEAGAHFGEIAALTGAPRTVEIIAESKSLLAECPQNAFDALMRSEPMLGHAIAQSLAGTVISLTDRLFELATLEVRYRLHSELLRLARTGEATPTGVLITNSPTQEVLAASIGSQREAVTRELTYLEAEGVLTRRLDRKLLIHDIDRLRQLAQSRSGVTASQLIPWEAASD